MIGLKQSNNPELPVLACHHHLDQSLPHRGCERLGALPRSRGHSCIGSGIFLLTECAGHRMIEHVALGRSSLVLDAQTSGEAWHTDAPMLRADSRLLPTQVIRCTWLAMFKITALIRGKQAALRGRIILVPLSILPA